MKIALAATEVAPFAKTGGLADVIEALPKTLEKLGNDVKVFMPKYSLIDENKHKLTYESAIGEMPIRVNGHTRSVHVQKSKINGSEVDIYFIDCPHYFYRRHIYTMDPDEDERFILFCKAVIETLQRLQWAPDVIHCNDWQTGLIPLFIKDNYSWDRMFDETATLMSIHNIAYQGRFPNQTIQKAELKGDLYYPGGPLEFYNTFSFLKTGIVYSEIISTVSETYSHEILTSEYGFGMEKELWPRRDDLFGVLNGADYEQWNPEGDPFIPYHYSAADLSNKLKNKEYLIKQTHLPFDKTKPIIGIVSRLVAQKGFDLVAEAINELMFLDAQWVILGSGEDKYEEMFTILSRSIPDKVWAYIGFNNELAHLIEAGADMFLMPSRYEPCGLNQMYSLKYGTVPIVRKTGGLADTVQDWHEFKERGNETGDGFSFNDATGFALHTTVLRAVETFREKKTWRKIQENGMNRDYSWRVSAKKYMTLYEMATKKRRGQ
ncbi:glycogen synthase GlgA [bacterium]|nr:glycogen synthase GlgA [bacterium]